MASSKPNYPLKATYLNTITLWLGASTYTSGEDTIQFIAHVIPMNIPTDFFAEIVKLILKCM